jgi:ribosomal protein S12 methylthiotransferase accessory factor
VERYAYQQPVPMRFSRYADLAKPIRPESIIRYLEEQYASGAIPFRPFNPEETCWWVDGWSLFTGDRVSILADCVLSPTVFEPTYRARLYTAPTTSGCASGLSREDAILRGAIELVERDAFMRHWLGQLGGSDVAPETLPDSIRGRMVGLQQHGVEIGIRCLQGGVYPSWMVWAQHESLHFTAVGSGSGLDAEEALKSALGEVENGVLQNLLGVHRGAVLHPSKVVAPEDHAALYATENYFRRANPFLRRIDSTISWSVAAGLFAGSPDAFLKLLMDKSRDVYWVDLSLERASRIANGNAVYTVRVIIPGLIPMAFGYNRNPWGMLSQHSVMHDLIHPFA